MAARDAGQPTKAVAERFDVSSAFVRRLVQRRREAGDGAVPTAGRSPGRKRRLAGREQELSAAAAARPDRSVRQLTEDLALPCSAATTRRELRRLGFTHKKKR